MEAEFMFKFRRSLGVVAVAAAIALVAAACGDDDDDKDGGAAGGGNVSGSLTISGSSTVEPITSLVAEKFAEDNPDVNSTVDGPGTTDGFALFCTGDTDINDASRQIKDEEVTACEGGGVEYSELEIGIDGISIITSTDNDSAPDCLTFEDLYALLGPESEGFENWSDAQALAAELGSDTEFPDAPLDITGPGEESGTWGSLIDIALKGIAEGRAEAGNITEEQVEVTRPDYQSSGNDNTIIEGVAGSESSLGWVGFAFADQNSDKVKTISIDGGDGCVEDTADTIADGSYPLSRSLYIYVNTGKLESNEALKPFVDFYLSDDGLASVEEADYIALPDDRVQATVDAWDEASSGGGGGGGATTSST